MSICYRKYACELSPQADYASIMVISFANLPCMKSHVARIVARIKLFPSPLRVSRNGDLLMHDLLMHGCFEIFHRIDGKDGYKLKAMERRIERAAGNLVILNFPKLIELSLRESSGRRHLGTLGKR